VITREKIGSSARKLLGWLHAEGQKVLRFGDIVAECQRTIKEPRKCFDLLFMLEQIGLLTQIEESSFVFTGLRGVAARFRQYLLNGCQVARQVPFEEIIFEGRFTSVRTSVLQATLLAEVLFKLASTKSSSKSQVEQLLSGTLKDNLKVLVGECLNLLAGLNFIEKNETDEVIVYVGPDFMPFEEGGALDHCRWQRLVEDEPAFWARLLELGEECAPVEEAGCMPVPMPASNLPEVGYAKLRARSWEYFLKKTVLIIGRAGGPWAVDLAIDRPSVSRQHAVIFLKDSGFAISCLSPKNCVKVDNLRIRKGEPEIMLKSRSIIRLGGEKIVFLLPDP
jgi:hypothetical protein